MHIVSANPMHLRMHSGKTRDDVRRIFKWLTQFDDFTTNDCAMKIRWRNQLLVSNYQASFPVIFYTRTPVVIANSSD